MGHLNFYKELEYKADNFEEVKQAITDNIVVRIKGVPSDVVWQQYYEGLGEYLGYLFRHNQDSETGNLVASAWADITYIAEKSKITFKYSNIHQPLHTDYSHIPMNLDVVIFYCTKKAPYGGATLFLPIEQMITLLKMYDADLYEALCTKEMNVDRDGKEYSRNVVKVIDISGDDVRLNWSYYRVSKDNPQDVLDMAEEFHYFLEEHIINAGIPMEVTLEEGEALLFQDKKCLHGRQSFFGDRCLRKGAIGMVDPEGTRKAVEAHLEKLKMNS